MGTFTNTLITIHYVNSYFWYICYLFQRYNSKRCTPIFIALLWSENNELLIM